jgi:ribulose-5-phosphate 4-epimerase/fuculose-1-phosphate aldolase
LAGKYASVLLANHGPVVSGETLEAAVFAIEELEETAKLYLLLRGLNPRYLTPGAGGGFVEDVRAGAAGRSRPHIARRHCERPLHVIASSVPT